VVNKAYHISVQLVTVCTAASGESSRRLVIMPEEETFVKPLGESMVLTCKVVTTDGRRPPAGSRLRWLDDNDREIVDVNGRSDRLHQRRSTGTLLYSGP